MIKFLRSYAQVAEDLLADFYLQKKGAITYIDVGCLWPVRHSNTFMFYERGGTGICIDPNPMAGPEYLTVRPRDTFVNCGVASAEGSLAYHHFDNPVFNTFSEARAAELIASGRTGRNLVSKQFVSVKPLTQILKEANWHDIHGPAADLLSIDVEGFELEVITSMDFDYLKPTLIIMEMAIKREGAKFLQAKQLLLDKGYKVCGETGHDLFLISRR